jgi:predicted phage terminase large subunit-like protein
MRTIPPPLEMVPMALTRRTQFLPGVDVISLRAEKCRRSFKYFVQEFWDEVVPEPMVWSWHMDVFCEEVENIFRPVIGTPIYDCRGILKHRQRQNKEYDLVINVPPGTTKSLIFTVMAPVWGWLNDPTLRFITGSYSADLSIEHSDLARDLFKCQRFQIYFPDLGIRQDKDVKSNYHNNKKGSRYTTSVGGTVTGMHAHIIIIDDPLNPKKAASSVELRSASMWMERTLSTRKVDKRVTPTILVMQRLDERDPAGMLLEKMYAGKKSIRHICLPGEIFSGATITKGVITRSLVQPPELAEKYVDGMLDPVRLGRDTLKELNADLGQYGYAGQIQQQPAPAEGGMFKVGKLDIIAMPPEWEIKQTIRYWDKAGTDKKDNPGAAHTAGVKICVLSNGKYCILDVVRGQWGTDEREDRILQTAKLDGTSVTVWIEQEPGSGGKDSARGTVKSLAGFPIYAECPTGDKVTRADPFSVQVNWGNVCLVRAPWNQDYIDEMSNFPFSKWKDQIDASAGGFNKIAIPAKRAGTW